MNVLLTGSTGFIGSNLLPALAEQHCVYTLIRQDTGPTTDKIQPVCYDGTYNSIEKGLAGKKIDAVVHLATHFCASHKTEDLDKLVDSNLRLGLQLLELSSETKIPYFISASTYAQSIDGPDYNPQNLYAATKQAFEDLMAYYQQVSSTRYITLELSDTYGPGDTRRKFINLAIDACLANQQFNMSAGEQEVNYLYVDDVVQAFITCLNLLENGTIGSGEKYGLQSDDVCTLSQLADLIWEIGGREKNIVKGFYPYRQREIMKMNRRYPQLPDWSAGVNLREGITRVMTEKQRNHDN